MQLRITLKNNSKIDLEIDSEQTLDSILESIINGQEIFNNWLKFDGYLIKTDEIMYVEWG